MGKNRREKLAYLDSTRVPSAAVVQQPPENASFQPKNNNDNGQPSHTSNISKDTLNRRTLTTTEFLFVKEGKRERERGGGGGGKKKKKKKKRGEKTKQNNGKNPGGQVYIIEVRE